MDRHGTGAASGLRALGCGYLFKPVLRGSYQTDHALGRLLPPRLWLPTCPPDSCAGELLVVLESEDRSRRWPLLWADDRGLHVGVDLERAIAALQREAFRPPLVPPITARLPFNYSRLPAWVKGLAELALSRLAKPQLIQFPSSPCDFGADFLQALACRLSGFSERPTWLGRHSIAIALSHDVDTAWVLRHQDMLQRIVEMEDRHGFKSTWHVVADYLGTAAVEESLEWLSRQGHEIASHGDNHDTRHPFLSVQRRRARWDRILPHARRLGMVGFRAAWLGRTDGFFDDMAADGLFRYDTSVPNSCVEGAVASRTGCTSCRPYFIRPRLVELPLVWMLESLVDQSLWCAFEQSIASTAAAGGLFTLLMHPQPNKSANPRMLALYERALDILARQEGAWKCRQADVAQRIAEGGGRPS